MAVRDLAGQVFGRLTVLDRAGSAPRSGKALWRCRCECGRETIVQGVYLTTGDTRSCGCLHLEATIAKGRAKRIDLSGQRFGRLMVIGELEQSRGSKGEIIWLCRCDCGRVHKTNGWRLRKGRCLSCGCLRDELQRARARAVGSAERIKACRTCGRIYTAVGTQKECSVLCRRLFHARGEAMRRRELSQLALAQEIHTLSEELAKRAKEQS